MQSTFFICTTWKRKQTMEQQPNRACKRMKSKQKQKQVTSHSNRLQALLLDSAHQQCNDIIKGWLYCLTSESNRRFLLVNNILHSFSLKNNFIRTNALVLVKKFKNKLRTKPGLLSRKHKNKVSRLAISKIIRTEHQNRSLAVTYIVLHVD